MTIEQQVSHPQVSHPETTPAQPATEPTAKPSESRTRKPRFRMPPPQVLAAVVLAVAALELLLWQVAGTRWGIAVHSALAAGLLAAVVSVVLWRRRQVRRAVGAARRQLSRTGGAGLPRAAGSLLGRLRGRSGGGSAGASRGGPQTGRSGLRSGLGRLLGGRSGSGPARSGSGLRGLLGGVRRSSGSGAGRPGASKASKASKAGGRGGLGGALSRIRSAGRSVAGGRTAGGRSGSSRTTGGGSGRQPATGVPQKPRGLRGLLQGVREGSDRAAKAETKRTAAQKKAEPEKPTAPKHAKPAEQPEAQKPKRDVDQLVKEAVADAAKNAAVEKPAAVPSTGGPYMGDMNRVRSAADELAAALKDYDPEDMHQLVREMPLLGEALTAVSAGIKQVASRAESEWPVAGPVVEGLRSIATDVKAGAATAEETRGTIRRENEVDIERGEAPRHGSHAVERKWNV